MTFSNETASGWQTAMLATPLALHGRATYVVSYYAPNGDYRRRRLLRECMDTRVRCRRRVAATAGICTPPEGASRAESYNATNYFVDVVFSRTRRP